MQSRDAYRSLSAGTSFRTWTLFLSLSFLCHILFFAALVGLPSVLPKPKRAPQVVNVTMVTLAEPASMPQAAAPPKPTAAPAPPKPGPAVRSAPTVSTRPSPPKPKRSLKKRTFRSSRVVQSAIEQIEERVEETRPDPLQKALERLKQDVETGKSAPPAQTEASAARRSAMIRDAGEGARKALELIDIYRVEIAYRIQKNWAFSPSLAGGREDLVVELAFNVLPDGTIADVWFDKRSGNRHLDDSARKAVLKSDPVSPHPEGLNMPRITVGLRFTPMGVE